MVSQKVNTHFLALSLLIPTFPILKYTSEVFLLFSFLFLIPVDLDDLMQEDYTTEQKCTWVTARWVQAQLKHMLLDEGIGATLPEDHATQLIIQVIFIDNSITSFPYPIPSAISSDWLLHPIPFSF